MNTFSNNQLPQGQTIITNHTLNKNIIQLKNQTLHPQIIKITVNQSITVKVSHNNSYSLSQLNLIKKKYIFCIQELDEETNPLSEGEQFQFTSSIFNKIGTKYLNIQVQAINQHRQNMPDKVGQYKLVCINIPKIQCKIIVQKSNSQSNDELFDSLQNINLNQQQIFIKTPVKLTQVKQQLPIQQQPEQQNLKQQKQQTVGLSNSKSDLQQYERILTQQNDSHSDTIENKYLKYFKQEFKLWRNFFQEQQQKEKKESLKSKHTKNLSLSQVKQIDPKHKSQYDEDSNDSNSQNNSSSIGKGVSIASHLYSHQQILDRNNDEDINSGRKQMKKTNSEYGFNIMRSQQKQPTLDKISVFGKQQEQINLPQTNFHHSRRSNHESYSKGINKNDNKKSRISMSRTQTNSPALKQYKKQNNFMTWVAQWAKQKQYKPVRIQKKNDHHLIKQFDTYMKNKFKITQFLYC